MPWELIFAIDLWAIYRDIVAFVLMAYGACNSFTIKALILRFRTNIRLRYRKKIEDRKKQKNPDGWSVGGVPVFLFKPAEKKYDANLAICSHRRRAHFIETLPGKSCRHNPKHANLLAKAIHVYQTQPMRRWGALWYYHEKVRNLAERRRIHDLTDSTHRYIAADFEPYRSSIAGGRYTPTADKALSNFAAMDIVYRVPSDNLDINKFIERESIFEGRWGCPVEISRPVGYPGAVRVRPRPKLQTRRWTPTIVNGLKTDLIFGRDRLNGVTISLPIKKVALKTHVMLLGPTGSGKSNHIGLWLSQLREMTRAQCVEDDRVVADVHFISQGTVGFNQYKDDRVRFATKHAAIMAELDLIESYFHARMEYLEKHNIPEWTGPLRVVVFDELQGWILGCGDKGMGLRLVQWSNEFRKTGILLMIGTQRARAQEGIPTGLTANCGVRLCGRVDEDAMATDFFTCDMKKFRHGMTPLQSVEGQFVMKHPFSHDFVYGQSDLAEHARVA